MSAAGADVGARASPEDAAMRVVFGYSAGSAASYSDPERLNLDYLEVLRGAGYAVTPFRLDMERGALGFAELDRRWRWGDRELLRMYERLEAAVDGATAFINGPGINLHPRFVETLPVVTVFQCMDDPESSAHLSRPVAASYDLCLVGNIAEVETYRAWGARNAEWIPMGLMPGYYDRSLTSARIEDGERDIDLVMLSDRRSAWRADRLTRLDRAFPEAHFYGPGWRRGYLPAERQVEVLGRSRIGPNVHNSTGPVNFRTFYLPANGVMQICDNRSHLARVFAVGIEVVGFDTIDECIDLCRYYLAHDDERRRIAVAGWRRARADYGEAAVHARRLAAIRRFLAAGHAQRSPRRGVAAARLGDTRVSGAAYPLIDIASRFARKARRALRGAR